MTQAVEIRELELGDAEALVALLAHERGFLEPWEPIRADAFWTLAGQQAQIVASRAAGDAVAYGIFIRETAELVGRIALSGIIRAAFQNAHLGYFVAERHNGRGYATEAVRQAVDAAFGAHGLHRVQAAVIPRNAGSIRVLEKAGFREEGFARRYLRINGVWEDHKLFAVTREEWSPARA